jgi:hypothetical protein
MRYLYLMVATYSVGGSGNKSPRFPKPVRRSANETVSKRTKTGEQVDPDAYSSRYFPLREITDVSKSRDLHGVGCTFLPRSLIRSG